MNLKFIRLVGLSISTKTQFKLMWENANTFISLEEIRSFYHSPLICFFMWGLRFMNLFSSCKHNLKSSFMWSLKIALCITWAFPLVQNLPEMIKSKRFTKKCSSSKSLFQTFLLLVCMYVHKYRVQGGHFDSSIFEQSSIAPYRLMLGST